MTEKYYRRTAAVVGALFIVATAISIVGLLMLGNSLDGPDFMLNLSENSGGVAAAALCELVLAVSLIGIGSLMFPVLRRTSEGLAMGYSIIRLTEAVFVVVSTISLLLMLGMSQGHAMGTGGAFDLQAMGALLTELREWALLFGTLIFLGLGAMVLNYLLYRAVLVPRWLSAWGFIGGVCVLLYGLLGLLDAEVYWTTAGNLLAAPIAVQEMVFAGWLIVKGLDTPADDTEVIPKREEGAVGPDPHSP